MTKRVELGPAAYRWLQRHRFVSEEALISVVLHTPESERKYTDENRFQLSFLKKKNRKFVRITLWIEERQTTLFIGKAHSERA
jgi:hypothetical protein